MIPCFIPREVFRTPLDSYIAYSQTSPEHYMVMASKDSSKAGKERGEASTDVSTQENVSPRSNTQATNSSSTSSSRHASSKAQQVRHRASVACAACRDRRIRCVVPQGQSECNQCRRTATECIIKNDDERRR